MQVYTTGGGKKLKNSIPGSLTVTPSRILNHTHIPHARTLPSCPVVTLSLIPLSLFLSLNSLSHVHNHINTHHPATDFLLPNRLPITLPRCDFPPRLLFLLLFSSKNPSSSAKVGNARPGGFLGPPSPFDDLDGIALSLRPFPIKLRKEKPPLPPPMLDCFLIAFPLWLRSLNPAPPRLVRLPPAGGDPPLPVIWPPRADICPVAARDETDPSCIAGCCDAGHL